MSEVKLLQCPFCGGEAEVIKAHSVFEKPYVVICKNKSCHASVGEFSENRKDAITAWNTRKPMERILERLEEKAREYTNDDLSYRIPCFGIDESIEIVKEGGIE